MATLLSIIETAGTEDEFAYEMAINTAKKLIRPLNPNKFKLGMIPLIYRVFSGIDYKDMKELPEGSFTFYQLDDYYTKFFQRGKTEDLYDDAKLFFGNPKKDSSGKELTQIVLGTRPKWLWKNGDKSEYVDNSVYIHIQLGNSLMPCSVISLRGNVEVTEKTPILYGWLPFKDGSAIKGKFDGHIEILIPKNLEYKPV